VKSTNSIKTNILWHRRLGLSIFIVLIFLAISGIALNHSPALKLSSIGLSNNWLLSWYGLEKPATQGFQLKDKWLYHDGNNLIFIEGKAAATCTAPLNSAASNEQTIFALCADALLLLTSDGELLERFSPLDGLPINAQSIAVIANRSYVLTDSLILEFNPDSLALSPSSLTGLEVQEALNQMTGLPKALKLQLEEEHTGPSISLETVILDLHSGRFFGKYGVLFMDIIGLLVFVLSITGLLAWINRMRHIK
jgi:hypothetical protein